MPARVCGGERGRDLDGDVEGVAQREGLDEPLIQRLALDVFHRDVRPAVGRLAEVVGVADVRMIERRGGARFLLEPRVSVGIRDLGTEHLERHAAIQLPIARGIHFSHAAHAKQAHNLERPELGPGRQEHAVDGRDDSSTSVRLAVDRRPWSAQPATIDQLGRTCETPD